MDHIEVDEVADPDLRDPVLVEGLPGVGHVGKLAAEHLLEELDAELVRRFYTDTLAVSARVRAVPYALRYLAVFLRELVTANVEVAYRVLSPSMPIDPDVIAVPLRVESDAAVTTIANSITLTPGTLTMDHDAETNTLYVHAIAGETDAVVAPIRTWEDYAIRIFDEDVSPTDPAPPARSGSRGGRRE